MSLQVGVHGRPLRTEGWVMGMEEVLGPKARNPEPGCGVTTHTLTP